MPIYEYECPKCGVFDAIQKVDDKPLKARPGCDVKGCPKCAERLISASAFHLKGTGWYKTDYSSGSNGSGKAKKGSSESSSADSSSSESGTEKKGEKKETALKTAGGGKCGSGCGCH